MKTDNETEVFEVEEPQVIDSAIALTASDKAQFDVQISTAKLYPRSITKSLQDAETLATYDENVAGSCFYSLPRGGKNIEGPSARMAEIICHAFGNIRVQGEITALDDKFLTATGTCIDLERNVGYRVSVKRRITDKHGRRYNDDMIGVTSNAAISIAQRNAVFKVVPRALWESIYNKARETSVGKGRTLVENRKNALEWFAKQKVNEKQVCELLGVRGLDDIGMEQLITLRGIRTAITEGDTTIEQLLSRVHEQSDQAKAVNEALKNGETK